jgi:hypothetical protein
MAWPCEVGGTRLAVLAAATLGGNWPWRAHTREVGRRGGHGGVLRLAYDRTNQRERWRGCELWSSERRGRSGGELSYGRRGRARCCYEGEG